MIYVITHKVFGDELIKDGEYKILHVGANNNCKEKYLRDDTGDNISEKNPHYCELTGLYWMWKNSLEQSSDPIGLVHYRRFFTYKKDDILYTYFGKRPRILTSKDIHKSLESYDVILPVPETIYRTVREFYNDHHNPNDLLTVRKVIERICPEYIESFDNVMDEHYFYYGNMIITSKELLNQYCEWLFSIMNEVEKVIIGSQIADAYQSRIYGFLSERLIQVWVEHNKLKIKTFPVFNTERKRMTVFQKNINRIKHAAALLCRETHNTQ